MNHAIIRYPMQERGRETHMIWYREPAAGDHRPASSGDYPTHVRAARALLPEC